jgi:hypothetical protein
MAAVQAASASAAALTTKRCHIAVSSAPATTSGPQPCASQARKAKSGYGATGPSPRAKFATSPGSVARQEQVAMRLAFAGHAGAHADRPDLLRMRMPRAIHPAMAEPGQARGAISAADYHRIAYCEVLGRDPA